MSELGVRLPGQKLANDVDYIIHVYIFHFKNIVDMHDIAAVTPKAMSSSIVTGTKSSNSKTGAF